MAFKFENLLVWQKALDLTEEINLLTKEYFPKDELFILTSQIKRVSDSVVLNIAEGCTGQTNPVLKTFLGIRYVQQLKLLRVYLLPRKEK